MVENDYQPSTYFRAPVVDELTDFNEYLALQLPRFLPEDDFGAGCVFPAGRLLQEAEDVGFCFALRNQHLVEQIVMTV